MTKFETPRPFVGIALSILAISGVVAWAVSRSAPAQAAAVALAGVAGVVTFAFGLSRPFAARRHRTMATGLVLVGAAVVTSAAHNTSGSRASFLAMSGGILFCAFEVADGSLVSIGHVERRVRGHWSLAWVLGVAFGSGALSYEAVSTRSLAVGSGPAALAVGTAAAVLVAFLVVFLLRTREHTEL
ncbi:MAG: hypothetical protein ABSG36_00090 [Acidimicrobiales bacterium]|jgi:hypothetical protein